MGAVLGAGRRRLCRGSPARLFLTGAGLTLTVLALAAGLGGAVEALAARAGAPGILLAALALKSTLAVRGLVGAARGVERRLAAGDLAAARAAVARDLVSRPTATLGAGHVASATIESVAENLTDAFVAPVAFFLVLGLPGALLYRALNTADTMLGYREGDLEYFGKTAARLDDVANLVPARLAALAIAVAAPLAGGDGAGAFRVMGRDHASTASPNAGLTMAAMAGALGVRLEKPGAYRLGDGPLPHAADITRALRVTATAAGMLMAALAVFILIRSGIR
jgi:adenosylcobinamide-phosphate synthase